MVIKPFFPPTIEFISFISLLDPAIEFFAQGGNKCQSLFISILLPSLDLDPLKRTANQLIIEFSPNLDLSIFYLDSLYNENITSLLETLAKDTYNTFLLDKDIV